MCALALDNKPARRNAAMRGLLATLALLLHVGNAQLLATLCGTGATNCVPTGPGVTPAFGCNVLGPLNTDGSCQQLVQSGVATSLWMTVSPASASSPSGFTLNLYSNAGCTGSPVGNTPNLNATGTAGCTSIGVGLIYATTATAYALTSTFQGAGCTGAAILQYSGPSGCQPTGGGRSIALQCGNTNGSAATVNEYNNVNCAGTPTATGGPPFQYFNPSTVGVCTNGQGGISTFATCVPGEKASYILQESRARVPSQHTQPPLHPPPPPFPNAQATLRPPLLQQQEEWLCKSSMASPPPPQARPAQSQRRPLSTAALP